MPRRSEQTHFTVRCNDAELKDQLKVCENSDFRVARDRATGVVTVHDRDTLILRAQRFGWWLVRLHRLYYRHPFSLSPDGNPPPGVP